MSARRIIVTGNADDFRRPARRAATHEARANRDQPPVTSAPNHPLA